MGSVDFWLEKQIHASLGKAQQARMMTGEKVY